MGLADCFSAEDKELLIGDGNNGGKENGKRHGKSSSSL